MFALNDIFLDEMSRGILMPSLWPIACVLGVLKVWIVLLTSLPRPPLCEGDKIQTH